LAVLGFAGNIEADLPVPEVIDGGLVGRDREDGEGSSGDGGDETGEG
jgi:hypothetical protein